jgi:CRP-like cAMP-binding protein
MATSIIQEKLEILKSTEIFKDFTDYVLKSIAEVLDDVEVKKGENIINMGEEGKNMYILYKGQAKIHADDVKIAEVFPVTILGEMALLTSEPRNASVTAEEDCKLLSLSKNAFDLISEDNIDFYKSIVVTIIKKLQKQNNELIEFSRNTRKILATF